MDVPTPSNVNHGFSHNTDGFLNISIESPNLDPLSTKRRRCSGIFIYRCIYRFKYFIHKLYTVRVKNI